MTSIFPIFPNRVAIITSDYSPLSLLYIPHWYNAVYSAVVNRATYSAKANNQVSRTLGGDVFVYTFGDAPGMLSIVATGAIFSNSGCGTNLYVPTSDDLIVAINALRRDTLFRPAFFAYGQVGLFGLVDSASIDMDTSHGLVTAVLNVTTLPSF